MITWIGQTIIVLYVGVAVILLVIGWVEIWTERDKWERPIDPWGQIIGAIVLSVIWPIAFFVVGGHEVIRRMVYYFDDR